MCIRDRIIIPNGTIERVINYNKGNAVAAVTISTAYESDTRKVMELIGLAVEQYAKEHEQLIEEEMCIRDRYMAPYRLLLL